MIVSAAVPAPGRSRYLASASPDSVSRDARSSDFALTIADLGGGFRFLVQDEAAALQKRRTDTRALLATGPTARALDSMHRQNLHRFRALGLIVIDVRLLVGVLHMRGVKGKQSSHDTMLRAALQYGNSCRPEMHVGQILRHY